MTRRSPRARTARGASRVGERFEVEVGTVAHGGHCIARVDGRAVFVRHALPGERVVVEVTEGTDGDRFWRADAVSVLSPSADRVSPPCPYAGPGLCGGCDWQHAALAAQRALKAAVVSEQLRRLAGLEVAVSVEEVDPVLRWRSRTRFSRAPDGGLGLRKHRSHDVVRVEDCLITAEPQVTGPRTVATAYGEHVFEVADDGFWQPHVSAPTVLVEAVLDVLAPQAGESVLDLYAGVGLFSAYLADAVGPGLVTAVEGSAPACAAARRNLGGRVRVEEGSVADVLAGLGGTADVVVLDPPREGAKRAVVEQVVARSPRAVAYVACDPAALARDVAIFAEHGFRLASLRAFDLFPMTHHVECVALLVP